MVQDPIVHDGQILLPLVIFIFLFLFLLRTWGHPHNAKKSDKVRLPFGLYWDVLFPLPRIYPHAM